MAAAVRARSALATRAGALKSALRQRAAAWARRRHGEDRLPVGLNARRVYILPTRAGMAFSLLLFVMLVAGLNYGNNVALMLTFLLAGFTFT